MDVRKPTRHRMSRRAAAHDYSAPGIYHITMHVADSLGQPFGTIVGDSSAADGTPDAPRVLLSPIGQFVEHELTHAIPSHYPMIEVQDHVIMPDHLHVILEAHDHITAHSGKAATLGQVISGFKKGCNRQYWEITHQGKPDGTNQGQAAPASPAFAGLSSLSGSAGPSPSAPSGPAVSASPAGAPAVSPQGSSFKVPSKATSGRQPLFAPGFCDVMPLRAGQLAAQRAYIKENPRSRLMRSQNRAWLTTRRSALTTALSVSALRGYLQRECSSHQVTPEILAELTAKLLTTPAPANQAGSTPSAAAPANHAGGIPTAAAPANQAGSIPSAAAPANQAGSIPVAAAPTNQAGSIPSAAAPANHAGSIPVATAPANQAGSIPSAAVGAPAVSPQGSSPRLLICCDSYGDLSLLQRRCLPVVCHRKDAGRFAEQKARCMEVAAHGAVLVSARIAKGEQAIMDDAIRLGHPVALIHDNGFTDRYHPSTDRLGLCAAGRLLLITPWQYHYRPNKEPITVPACKAMNCVAQSICRTSDEWWKQG